LHLESSPVFYRISYLLKAILLLEVLLAVWGAQWQTAVITSGIIAITMIPLVMKKRFRVYIPMEFEVLVIAFVFAALFLGEVRGYYVRFWWWDIALHTSSGLLLGMIGFLLVHFLNEVEDVGMHMKPGFVAFFAFLFAVGFGAIWEIFEFAMDSLFGLDMQKTMLGDPSGLTDTMWDLIVATLGALVISILGYGYLKSAMKESFLERWIGKFVDRNPRFFDKRR
jgi:hypothetical protein